MCMCTSNIMLDPHMHTDTQYMHTGIQQHTYVHTYIHAYIHTDIHASMHIYTYMQHVDTRRDIHACTLESVDSEIGRKTDKRKIDRQIDS